MAREAVMRAVIMQLCSGETVAAQAAGAELQSIEGSPVTFIRAMSGAVMVQTGAGLYYVDKQSYAKQVLGVAFY